MPPLGSSSAQCVLDGDLSVAESRISSRAVGSGKDPCQKGSKPAKPRALGFGGVSSFIRAGFILVGVFWCIPLLRERVLDHATARVWNFIYANPAAHWQMAEALVATLGFWMSASFYETLHLWCPCVLRHRIVEGNASKATVPVVEAKKKPEVFRSMGFFLWTKVGGSAVYLAAIWVYHAFLRSKPPLPLTAPSFTRLAVEVFTGIVLYDLNFTPLHWFLHRAPSRTVRRCHLVHHEMKGTLSAGATVHHSLVDGGLQVLVNILVQQITPFPGGRKHIMSRFLHNLAVTYLLSESHSGYDLPFMSHRIFPAIFGGAPRHNAHHNCGDRYFQQFFMYIDDMGSQPRRRSFTDSLNSHTHAPNFFHQEFVCHSALLRHAT